MNRSGITAGVAASVLAAAASAQVSTFDTDAEGWGTFSDATNFTWTDAVGNPAGAIRASDQRAGDIWFFAAPSASLGDKSDAYGQTLSWDILGLVGNQTSISPRADVMLVGGGLELGIDLGVLPLTTGWTGWEVTVVGPDNFSDTGTLDLSGADFTLTLSGTGR